MASALWGRVLTDGRELAPSRIEIIEGRITSLETRARPESGDLVVEQGWIVPGLIDLQVNGAGGVDLTSAADPGAALEHVARTLVAHGVTAFCPTIVSSPRETILDCLRTYAPRPVQLGAESLGLHVEGPFIDPEHRGVHDPSNIRPVTADELNQWLQRGPPSIVTLAPEQPGGVDAIQQLTECGVVVSLGHSGADVAVTQQALAAGARMATHLFNAMPPLHHRRPGLVGAVLASPVATLGLIADGAHVHPLMIDLVVNRHGTGRVALVSDALAPAGAPPGPSRLGDQPVISDGISVRRTDGTLAGCAVLLDACLQNARRWLPELPPAQIVEMATSTPAAALGLQRKGSVAVGCDADLVVLDDDFNVKLTIVRGERVSD